MGSYKHLFFFFSGQLEIRGIYSNLRELWIIVTYTQVNTGTCAMEENVSLLFKLNISVFILPIVWAHIVTCIQHRNDVQGQWQTALLLLVFEEGTFYPSQQIYI